MDTLAPLFARFTLNARVFYSGLLCNSVNFDAQAGVGHLHVLRSGRLRLTEPGAPDRELNHPSLLFYPRPRPHGFLMPDAAGANLVCASIDFGAGSGNPLLDCLPDLLLVPLQDIRGVDFALGLLFDEAFGNEGGRQAAIDRLMEYLLVLLLRHAIARQLVQGGLVAALGDSRLARACLALHEKPEHDWTLEEMAETAGMSRARFAAHFRQVVGRTPLDYLTDWRIGVAQGLLRKGKSPKLVAPLVGYSNPTAFARVFERRVGQSPATWRTLQALPASP